RGLAERWSALWAEEVGRELGGLRDEFDRWLAGERIPDNLAESLRTRLHAEVSGRLPRPDGARFTQNSVRFDGEPARADRSRLVLTVRRSASAAEVLRELRRREEGNGETTWREPARAQF